MFSRKEGATYEVVVIMNSLTDSERLLNVQGSGVSFWQAEPHVHVFQLSDEGAEEETVGDDQASVSACQQWVMPAVDFDGLWDSLVYVLFLSILGV